MIRQKPISARIDFDRINDLEQERYATGVSANRIINEGVKYYCHIVDTRRRYGMFNRKSEWNELCDRLCLPELRFIDV